MLVERNALPHDVDHIYHLKGATVSHTRNSRVCMSYTDERRRQGRRSAYNYYVMFGDESVGIVGLIMRIGPLCSSSMGAVFDCAYLRWFGYHDLYIQLFPVGLPRTCERKGERETRIQTHELQETIKGRH